MNHPGEENTLKSSRQENSSLPGEVERMISIIEKVASGDYSIDISEFTRSDRPEATRRIAEAFGMMMVKIEAREYHLQKVNEELRKLNRVMQKNVIQTVTTIAHGLGARDAYTEGHGQRVALYAHRLALRLGLLPDEIEHIRIGGLLHDIGKIGFSDSVLSNTYLEPTKDMLQEIRNHPQIGRNILKDLDFLEPVLDYVLYHHEREDGSGYPCGLKGEKIPLGAKMIGIADCFDALTSERSYQKASSLDNAVGILRTLSKKVLSRELTDAFIAEIRENGIITGFKDRDNAL